jgi:dTMP kinase
MLITFEGIDFCGKSTQAKLLHDFLKRKKKKVIFVREPGGTYISEKIRDLLLDKKNKNMKYLTEFLLFSASRHQLVEEIIRPLLRKNYIVICDRYYDSSTAYQGFGGKLPLEDVKKINKIATGNLIPDLTFIVNIDYKEAIRRKQAKKNLDDRIEQKDITYFNKVINGYLSLSKKEKRFVVLDGGRDIEQIHLEILNVIKKSLKFKL